MPPKGTEGNKIVLAGDFEGFMKQIGNVNVTVINFREQFKLGGQERAF